MTWFANSRPRDDVADAAQFLSRIAYAVLALGAPVGVVLHPLAIFLLLPIGIVLLVFAAALEPPPLSGKRLVMAYSSPVILLALCWLAWAALSILWTPFTVEAGQQLLRYAGLGFGLTCAFSLTREHAKATDLYFFPIGVVLTMITIMSAWIASKQGATIDPERIDQGGLLIATLLFPAMGGLAARIRNGYARVLMILAFVYEYAVGSPSSMIALFVGLTVLSFAISDLKRTTRDLSWGLAAAVAFAPLLVLIVTPLARLLLHANLKTLPPPYPSLAYVFTVVTEDWARLITGHGFETVTHGVRIGALPPEAPHTALFQVWYELGIVGAWIVAAGIAFAFRAIGEAPTRLAPYLAAAFACVLALGATRSDLDDWTWLMMLSIALVGCDVAARSQYRTTRPSAEHIANF
jgi:hypothetical protein